MTHSFSQATCVGRHANAQASLQVCVQESEIYSRHSLQFYFIYFFLAVGLKFYYVVKLAEKPIS